MRLAHRAVAGVAIVTAAINLTDEPKSEKGGTNIAAPSK